MFLRCFFASFALLALAPASAQDEPAGVLLDRIVAVVNDGVVLQSELDQQMAMVLRNLSAQNQPLPPRSAIEEQLLERLIVVRIQIQRADSLGIRVSDEQLNRALAEIARRNNISLSQLPAALAEQGVGYAEYREEMRREMLIEQLRARDVLSRINVTPKEVEESIARAAEQDESIEYNLRHILLATPGGSGPDKLKQAEAKAAELYDRLDKGENFGRMAIAYSGGSQAMQGGDLGWKRITELPTLFVDAVTTLGEGEVSKPIRSPSGFHIIQLAGKRGVEKVVIQQRNVRHILIQPNAVRTLEQAHDKIAEIRQRITDGDAFGDLAREHSDDKANSNAGGDMGWTNPGTFVTEFETALGALKPGELSQPVRTPYGWHLIELLGVRDYDSTQDMRRGEVLTELRRQKMDVDTERWLRQLRDEAYVEVRL